MLWKDNQQGKGTGEGSFQLQAIVREPFDTRTVEGGSGLLQKDSMTAGLAPHASFMARPKLRRFSSVLQPKQNNGVFLHPLITQHHPSI